jgi:hypothetical protein
MTERTGFGWRSALLLGIGAVLGIVVLTALRFAGQPPHQHVHYHANWAVFVNGERLDLTDERYMEDVFQCMADPSMQRPEDRVHMHENNQDVVHVHASGVTWGHLLANLGFGIGEKYLETDQGRLAEEGENTLKFILNGRPIGSVRNQQIGNQDRLLISYGPESVEQVLATQYPVVEENAGVYNTMPDPASCSGQAEETFGDRLRRAVWY